MGAAILGTKCKVRELDDADNARGLGKNAMVVDCLMSFSSLVRALARVEKEKAAFRPRGFGRLLLAGCTAGGVSEPVATFNLKQCLALVRIGPGCLVR